MNIRKFTSDDYAAIVEIRNSLNIVWPAWPKDPETWMEIDRNRDPKCLYQRWVAEEEGKVVGAASFGRRLDDFHPQKFYINIQVLEAYRRHGIGTALYKQLMKELQPYDPIILRTDILENQLQSYPFVQKRGFKEVWRETPVHLDVAGCDLSTYADLEITLKAEGISIKSLHDIKNNQDRDRRVYDLYMELAKDMPSELPEFTIIPYEDWVKITLEDPTTSPQAFFIAVHKDQYIALHETVIEMSDRALLGGLLGTLPAFRNKHIGLALILRAIKFAQNHNIPVFKTCTAITNNPMQNLFNKLGFTRDPEWLQCEKVITPS
ncbi:MAG: GNAT family N-acetyltransferase [Anaerolineales bacterium]|nr:GNAT family N-acetyltransferase [Anaerolineales bacterium]